MKKIFLICAFILNSYFVYANEPEKFKNPIFYKTLYSLATKGNTIKITPSSYYVKNYSGYETSAKCKLLDNEINKIVLKCLHSPTDSEIKKELIYVPSDGKPISWIYKFIIPSKEQQVYKGGKRIILYPRLSWEKEEDSLSYENYIIYTSEEN